MLSPGFFYMLVSVVLFAVAVVVHFHSSTLSLPLSSAISILTIILPIASLLNAYIYPTLLHASYAPRAGRFQQLRPMLLQVLQALVTVVLVTLLFEGTVPSQALNCLLDNEWMKLYKGHRGFVIRRIQDTLDCCGYNSVRDRAYPFGSPSTCAATYERDVACRGRYRQAMQLNSGLDLMVVLVVGLTQIIGLLAMREGTNWWTAWRARVWVPSMVQPETTRPLLGGPELDEEAADSSAIGGETYGTTTDDTSRPRVEPSPINDGTERNAWNE